MVLPDTHGVAYRTKHVKSTISPGNRPGWARLGYFHNAGYFELEGEDFAGALGIGGDDPARLPPYVELVRLNDCGPMARRWLRWSRRPDST